MLLNHTDHIPTKNKRSNQSYYARLTSDDVEVRRGAAREWTRWEMATSRLFPDPEYLDKAEDLDFAVALRESNVTIYQRNIC